MDYAPQKSKDWNTGYLAGLDVGYASGYKAEGCSERSRFAKTTAMITTST
jgi:hypothetical protein